MRDLWDMMPCKDSSAGGPAFSFLTTLIKVFDGNFHGRF